VWHHELRSALDAGVRVFGAASMGALRAAELAREGMRGVGRVHAWVRDGEVHDDADVALLHAGAEHGWRGFTVPLVTVRDRAEAATRAGVLRLVDARALMRVASGLHFADRTWSALRSAASEGVRRRWSALESWLATAGEDVKARDARACLRQALAVRGAGKPRASLPSAAARRQSLVEPSFAGPGGAVRGTEVLAVLRRTVTHQRCSSALLIGRLAGWARQLGPARRSARSLPSACVVPRAPGRNAERAGFLATAGLDGGTARLCEDVACLAVRAHSMQVLPDGPTGDEAPLTGAAGSSARNGGASQSERAMANPATYRARASAIPRRGALNQ
jgi:hypothetical protein